MAEQVKPRRRDRKNVERAKAASMYLHGASDAEIAKELGVNRARVHQILDEAKVKKRKPGPQAKCGSCGQCAACKHAARQRRYRREKAKA